MYFWIVFVDRSICFIFDVAEKFSQEKGGVIRSTTKEHIFLDDFPLFDFEMFLFLGVGLLIGGDFFVLDKGVE